MSPSFGKLVVVLLVPFLAYLGVSAGQKLVELAQLRQQAEQLRREIDDLQARNLQLRRQIEYLRSDAYVEKVAREELNLIRPGDVAIAVVAPPLPEQSLPAGRAIPGRPRANWERWWDHFFAERRR